MSKKNGYIILGVGKLGSEIAQILFDNGYSLIGIDKDNASLTKFSNLFSYTLNADATNVATLLKIGVASADAIFVTISDVLDSITVCANLVDIGVNGLIIAVAQNDLHKKVLKVLGIESVIVPLHQAAKSAALHAIYHYGDEIHPLSDNHSWMRLVVDNPKCINTPINKFDLSKKLGTLILYIVRGGNVISPVPHNMELNIGDVITIACSDEKINKSINFFTVAFSNDKGSELSSRDVLKKINNPIFLKKHIDK